MEPFLWLTAVLVIVILVATWLGRRRHRRLLAAVRVVTLRNVSATMLGNSRDVVVYLPPGYDAKSDQTYPVLYVNDGQDREALKLHETLARLMDRREIRPVIVVTVPTNDNRLREYGTAVAPNAQGLGDFAPAYANFFSDDLMPMIDGGLRTCGRALVCGMSLGGLSAFDLFWNDPERFGVVGVFSGSFWWRAADDETAIAPGQRIAHEMVRRGPYRPGQRFWFQTGTRDETSDRDDNGVIDAIQDTTELIDELRLLGYEDGKDVVYCEVPAGRHNYETWSKVFPDFLRWALPPNGSQPGCAD